MSGRTSERAAAELRRVDVAELYVKKWSLSKIAEKHGVSVMTICKDLKAIRAAWREKSAITFDEFQAEALAKLDLIEAENWAEWERSKQARQTNIGEKADEHNHKGAKRKTKTSMRTEQQTGATEYMKMLAWCWDRRMTLLGFTPPTKIAMTNSKGDDDRGGIGAGSPLAAIFTAARAALERFGPQFGQTVVATGGEVPAALGSPVGTADAGVPESG